jgi:hypothetical protein
VLASSLHLRADLILNYLTCILHLITQPSFPLPSKVLQLVIPYTATLHFSVSSLYSFLSHHLLPHRVQSALTARLLLISLTTLSCPGCTVAFHKLSCPIDPSSFQLYSPLIAPSFFNHHGCTYSPNNSRIQYVLHCTVEEAPPFCRSSSAVEPSRSSLILKLSPLTLSLSTITRTITRTMAPTILMAKVATPTLSKTITIQHLVAGLNHKKTTATTLTRSNVVDMVRIACLYSF